jgi:hypothetical protein
MKKKEDLLPDGGENKNKPGVDGEGYSRFVYVDVEIEHFSEPRNVRKTKGTTLDVYDDTPLARWFRDGNPIVGVL